jgi:hypothetical protein
MTADEHCCTSRCCSDDACCSTTLHMQQHMHCSDGHSHASSARGVAPQARSAASPTTQQQDLMASSSSGPVTTRMHAAAICCKYTLGTSVMGAAETVSQSPTGHNHLLAVRSTSANTVANDPPAW